MHSTGILRHSRAYSQIYVAESGPTHPRECVASMNGKFVRISSTNKADTHGRGFNAGVIDRS